eukprot:SAG31_NODE_24162_length_487_cov_19.610825_1_plen_99_part_00
MPKGHHKLDTRFESHEEARAQPHQTSTRRTHRRFKKKITQCREGRREEKAIAIINSCGHRYVRTRMVRTPGYEHSPERNLHVLSSTKLNNTAVDLIIK